MPDVVKIKNMTQTFLNLLKKGFEVLKKNFVRFCFYLRRSWKSVAVIVPLVLIFYYCLGGFMTHKIDKNPDYSVQPVQDGLHFVATSAGLIKREIDEKMWTPNLPVIFPGVVLDNMPAFQKGIMATLKTIFSGFSKDNDSQNLDQAVKLLKYPPDIWLLSKDSNLSLAPSSGAQYRKAARFLQNFNDDEAKFAGKDPVVLNNLLKLFEKNLKHTDQKLEDQIREHSSDWFDLKADDVFYFAQGRIYASYVLLRALLKDYKEDIVRLGVYDEWVKVEKSLEDAFSFDPLIVRNGQKHALISPNHLSVLRADVNKALYYLSKLEIKTEDFLKGKKDDH